jgi:hypothetical protein
MATSKLDCIHLHVVEIIFGNFITLMATRKLGCIHLYALQIKLGNYINTSREARKLGCIHLYVMHIKFKNYVNILWQESWVAFIYMWCRSNLKIISTTHGYKKIGLHSFVCGVNQTQKLH